MDSILNRPPTKEDIVNAYRFILGREPENDTVISSHLKEEKSVASLRDKFLASEEFNGTLGMERGAAFNILEKFQKVDVDIEPEQLDRLMDHIQTEWSRLGASKPFWSVLSHDDYADRTLTAEKLAGFYETGKYSLKYIMAVLKRVNEPLPAGDCLEYGCGVGRNLVHLAPHFKNLVGVDISRPLLELAGKALDEYGIKNVTLKRLSALSQINYIGEFQFIFSVIVLQHNPPPIIARILDSLFGLLAPGGIFLFQCPVVKEGYSFDINHYLAAIDKRRQQIAANEEGEIEMHCIPQYKIFEIARRKSCYPLEVHCDDFGNTKYVLSQSFIFKKI